MRRGLDSLPHVLYTSPPTRLPRYHTCALAAAPTDLVYDSLSSSFTNVSARLHSLTSNVTNVVVHLDVRASVWRG